MITYLANSLYNNIMEMWDFAMKTYDFYAFPFQVIFPILLLLGAEIKRRWGTWAKLGSCFGLQGMLIDIS
ncbi:hypothetical protein POTG_04328 [Paenibacillus sp. oral taxon 786 str. D14]|nr:hypothetical protein POTG_04328 [Paenibacillus sp. oral taxon 786 str. D14]